MKHKKSLLKKKKKKKKKPQGIEKRKRKERKQNGRRLPDAEDFKLKLVITCNFVEKVEKNIIK